MKYFCKGTLCDIGTVIAAWLYIWLGHTIDAALATYAAFTGNLDTLIGIATLILIIVRIRKNLKKDK